MILLLFIGARACVFLALGVVFARDFTVVLVLVLDFTG
jgi:hypothetical protein